MIDDKKAVAIEYKGDIPKICAQASGHLVERLLQIAAENNIEIYRDPDLTEILSTVKKGSEIPEDLFRAVAEVLSYCYNVNSDFRSKIDTMDF